MNSVEHYTSAPAVRQQPLIEGSDLSQQEKITQVIEHVGRTGLLIEFARFWTKESEDPEVDAQEVAHNAAVLMMEDENQAKVDPLTGVVEIDLTLMKNWIYSFLKNMWLQLRDGRERERTGRKKYEVELECEELDDCGSHRTPVRGSKADINTDDRGPTTLPTESLQVQRPASSSQSDERDVSEVALAALGTATIPKGTPAKKKGGKPQPREDRQPVSLKGGRTHHRWKEDRGQAKVARDHDINNLKRWPQTYRALLLDAQRGTTTAAATYGLPRKTFEDRRNKSLKAMQAYALTIGSGQPPVTEGPEAKVLDKIEAQWVEVSQQTKQPR